MKKYLLVMGILLIGIKEGRSQELYNTLPCRIYIRGTVTPCGIGDTFGPHCVNPGDTLDITNVACVTIHLGCPACGENGVTVGPASNCCGAPQTHNQVVPGSSPGGTTKKPSSFC
jgi:hypothetical protein